MSDVLKLIVNGRTYEGWRSIEVKRSMKAIAGAFNLAVIAKWAEQQVAWPIAPGDSCEIQIGGETVITGYVDDAKPSLTKDDAGIAVAGRDKTGDLVDCSVDFPTGAFTNVTLLSLCKKIAGPFGIGVKVDTGVTGIGTPFPAWKVNQGESCFETLERAARLRQVLLSNDGQGNILITRAGTARAATALVQGQNILSAEAAFSFKERFSKYTVKSQDVGLGEDGPDPLSSFQPAGHATDSAVKRYRPLMIVAEGAATAAICSQRARWEAAVRVGRSSPVTVRVPGWRQGDGQLWKPNQITVLRSPTLGLNLEMLITEVALRREVNEDVTELRLESVAAYTPDPTLNSRKDPFRQLVLEDAARKPGGK